MNLTLEQVNAAVAAGLAMTNEESDAPVPMKFAAGAVILHQVLLGIASGQLLLRTVEKPVTDTPPKISAKPPVGKRKTGKRRAAKKKRPGKKKK